MESSRMTQEPAGLLRSHGLRATPQRIAVAELLLEKPVHVTPNELYASLKDRLPSISPNTIYLTLAHFEEAGLVRRFHIDGQAVFDSNTTMHDHAFCCACGAVVDVAGAPEDERPAQLAAWNIRNENRVWIGLCPDCKPG
jgi:Fur family peroxide stress response transcriptional regulator